MSRGSWRAEALRAMDEHHLVAWSDQPVKRARFAAEFQRFLVTQPDSEFAVIHGRSARTLDELCDQLERQLVGPVLERTIDGPRGLTEFLRHVHPTPGAGWPKARYFLWNDADIFLRIDPTLFGRVVDAMLGVAAENEFGTGEGLTIQRVVFTGGPSLERYARDQQGQFKAWVSDGHDEPFWRLVTGLEHPPVVVRPVDLLVGA